MPLNVLIVEDSEEDADLIVLELQTRRFRTRLPPRRQCPGAWPRLCGEREWDLVLSDYSMPHFTVTEALEMVQATRPRHPLRHRLGDHRRRGRGGGDAGRRSRLYPQTPARPAGSGGQPRAEGIRGAASSAATWKSSSATRRSSKASAYWPAAWPTISITC